MTQEAGEEETETTKRGDKEFKGIANTSDRKVVLTGAGSEIGKLILKRLLEARFEVTAIDRVPYQNCPIPQSYHKVDLKDEKKIEQLFQGHQALIHAGEYAVPSKFLAVGMDKKHAVRPQISLEDASPSEILDYNTRAARIYFEAAAKVGMTRIVYASSIFAFGWSHNPLSFTPLYLPIDEEHPLQPQEAFGLSKLHNENFAALIAKNTGLSIISLRLASLHLPPIPDDKQLHMLQWPYLQREDVGNAFVAALQAHGTSLARGTHEAFIICAPTTVFTENTLDILKPPYISHEYIVIRDKTKLKGNASILSNEKAKKITRI